MAPVRTDVKVTTTGKVEAVSPHQFNAVPSDTLSFFVYTSDSFANVHNDTSQGGKGKAAIRMRKDKTLALGHFKRLMIMLFLCSHFSSCFVAADDIQVSCFEFFRSCC